MNNNIPIIIKEAQNNFEWFQHIIKGITNEVFEDTDYNTLWEFEKKLLEILSKSYNWKEWYDINQSIFSIEKMSKYIQSDKKIAKNFCPLYINEDCKGLINYINNFNHPRLENSNKSFLQMWKTLEEIKKNFKKEISKYDYFENISDYIYYINKNILINFYPETLKKKLENLWVDKKDTNMICSSVQHINENNIMSYINSILTKSYTLHNKENHIFSIRKKIKKGNIEIKKEIKMILLLYIDKSKIIHIKPINPEYIETEFNAIKNNYGHVFILQKPLLPII